MRKEKNHADGGATREELWKDLTEVIRSRSQELIGLGYSADMARFDCLMTVKIIVDEMYDEFNVGNARKEWYREMVRSNVRG